MFLFNVIGKTNVSYCVIHSFNSIAPFPCSLTLRNRMVTKSIAPYAIVYANASFFNSTGHLPERIVGASFLELLFGEPSDSDRPFSLADCVVSSSNGENRTITLRPPGEGSSKDPFKCRIKVSPVVARKTKWSELTNVTHFAIEIVVGDDNASDGHHDGVPHRRRASHSRRARRRVPSRDHAVGVMG